MVHHQSRKLVVTSLALMSILVITGCFYSDAPLLDPSRYALPIRSGLWESLAPVSGQEWQKMSRQDKMDGHCRTVSARNYCGHRVRIAATSERNYRLAWEGEKTVDIVEVEPLSANHFIVEQVSGSGSAEYALATLKSRDAFTIRMPDCDTDRYLHAYAPPDSDTSSICKVADRQRLHALFAEYQGKSSEADAKLYRRIGD